MWQKYWKAPRAASEPHLDDSRQLETPAAKIVMLLRPSAQTH